MRSKHRRRIVGAAALGVLLVFIGIGSVIPLRRGYTPQYPSPDSIASLEQITLGGSPQWVLIRGEKRNNPLLLWLHGGPGMPTMYLAHDFQRELERSFVVVQWDRRGAGKSFAAGQASPEMTVSREVDDTLELIDQLRSRFHQEKVYLVGFSYGSYLGILVALRAPEVLHAYVGIGQVACSDQESRTLQDSWIREQATRASDHGALDELDGKKPLDREKWLFKYGAEIHSAHNWWPLLWSGLRSPEYTFQDVLNVKRGVGFTASKLRYDVIKGSILENVSALQIPVYFFTGRFDYTDPKPCIVRLLDNLNAPAKKIIWFEDSAHFVFLDEPSRFAAEMRRVAE
jgi:pimeloyl-ACP methyl ester carboxylesterase